MRGIGVDEATFLLLDGGILHAVGNGTAYMCEIGPSDLASMRCNPGEPLTVPNVYCERLQASGFKLYGDPSADSFNVYSWLGTGVRYSFSVLEGSISGQSYGP